MGTRSSNQTSWLATEVLTDSFEQEALPPAVSCMSRDCLAVSTRVNAVDIRPCLYHCL